MPQKKQTKKYCIKTIKGNHYLYTWTYRPQYLRTKRKKQRYIWTYIGKYESKLVQKLLSKLSQEEHESIKHEYEQKVQKYQLKQDLIKVFENKEPFKTEKDRISNINNRLHYLTELRKYERKLRDAIRKHLSEQ